MDRGRRLDAATTALVTDSAADVRGADRPANWRVVPIPITFLTPSGPEAFRDGVDLDPAGFYARLETADTLPTTAQPAASEIADVLREALERHESAVMLPLSGRMSGTVDAAREAAGVVGEDRVLVMETGQVSITLGLMCLRVQARLARGTTAGALERDVAVLRQGIRAVFSVETLEYLQRGGRIGRAQALAGSLLRVRPVLEIAEGEVRPAGRVRGAARVIPAMRDYLAERTDPDRPLSVAYGHVLRPEAAAELRAAVEEIRPGARTELVAEIGPTVGTHSGPGLVAVSFVHDPPEG